MSKQDSNQDGRNQGISEDKRSAFSGRNTSSNNSKYAAGANNERKNFDVNANGPGGKKGRKTKVKSNNPPRQRYSRNSKSGGETIEDIKNDILRIEKEIQLELKEIKSLKLGL
ncbi:MAG TPA: hypothetical protein GXX49_07740 [Clostridiaceae bacterium]|jgi:hypothetical protein|nr:hypothetical protein [Clostridiaceae bacterium]